MRILLISTFFYPQNRIAVLRIGQWAKYWAFHGHEVTVLTTKKYPFLGPYGLSPSLPDNVEVVEVPFLPEWLRERLSRRPAGDGAAKTTGTSADHLKRRVRKLRGYIGSLIDIHDLWVSPARRKGMELMAARHYDVIVSSFSPPAVHMVASRLKAAHPDTVWLADFRDLWTNNHVTSARGVLRWMENALEQRTITHRADAISTVSAPLAEDLRRRYPHIPVWVIENGFDPEEFPDWAARISHSPGIDRTLRICYAGTLYPGRRDPTPLFNALNTMIDNGVLDRRQVAVDFYGQNEKELAVVLENCHGNRHGIVHAHGFVSREESLAAQARSSLLLLLESSEPAARGVLTGKLFEYLVSGIPILAVGIDSQNAAAGILQRTGTGAIAKTAEEITTLLTRIISTGQVDFYKPQAERIAEYARDRQAQRMMTELAQMKLLKEVQTC
jgi:hypothetical protein